MPPSSPTQSPVTRGPGRLPSLGPTRALRMPAQGLGVWQPPAVATATTTRYVRKTGSDSNGGTSPSDAWLTIGKALTTASPGTAVYVGAGVYRETVTVTITPTASLPVWLIGDVDGAFTGDPGMVQWTAYTTDDKTAAAALPTLVLNGRANLTFRNIFIVGGNNGTGCCISSEVAGSSNISFLNCDLLTHGNQNRMVSVLSAAGAPLNWTFDSCRLFGRNANVTNALAVFTLTRHSSDYDVNAVFRNCLMLGGSNSTVRVVSTGAGAGFGGGVRVRNSWLQGVGSGLVVADANVSVSVPCAITGSIVFATSAVVATTQGQIVEDYNLFVSGTPRTLVSIGAHSNADFSYAPLFHFGQEQTWGGTLRPFGEPMASSPLSGFAADGTQPPFDLRNGPRVAGALQAVGAYQRGNNFAKETGTVHTGSNAVSVTGPGYQDFDVAVDASAVTVSVYCQRDSSYTGPTPQLQILPNEEAGVGTNNADGTPAGVNAWEQMSVTFTPTAKGIVTVRVISNDTSGAGKTIFDSFAVS